jgi:hypothetical protein
MDLLAALILLMDQQLTYRLETRRVATINTELLVLYH